MSNTFYERKLQHALTDLRERLEQEEELAEADKPQTRDKKLSVAYDHKSWSTIYIPYLAIFRDLEACYDQMIQPQKRAFVKVLLDSVLGRILDLRHQISSASGEFKALDDILLSLGLTPDALEITIPRYYYHSRRQEVEERDAFLSRLVEVYSPNANGRAPGSPAQPVSPQPAAGANAPPRRQMSLEEAIAIIQRNERGLQGRRRARFMARVRADAARQGRVIAFAPSSADDYNAAAISVQKAWKGYVVRRKVAAEVVSHRRFLGMEHEGRGVLQRVRARATAVENTRRQRGVVAQLDMDQHAEKIMKKMQESEVPRLFEDMRDAVMMKAHELRALIRAVPEYPTAAEGGAAAFVQRLAPLNGERLLEDVILAKKVAAEAAQPGAARAAAVAAEKAAAAAASGGGAAADPRQTARDVCRQLMARGIREYSLLWVERVDPRGLQQKHDPQLLRMSLLERPPSATAEDVTTPWRGSLVQMMNQASASGGVRDGVRELVDDLIRVELANLKTATTYRQVGKYKAPKAPKAKQTAAQRREAAAAAKALKRDLTHGRAIESIVNELVWTGFMYPAPRVRMSEYVGDHSVVGSLVEAAGALRAEFAADTKRKWEAVLEGWNDNIQRSLQVTKEQFAATYSAWVETKEGGIASAADKAPGPTVAQAREAIIARLVLPLGSEEVWAVAPTLQTCVLSGPSGTGKTMLAHAIATETGATFFDLSPATLGGKYEDAEASRLLVHMVFKVAKALAPSVIMIDEVEKIFPAKGKKGGKKGRGVAAAAPAADGAEGGATAGGGGAGGASPVRIKRDLLANIKLLTPSDRVCVLGLLRDPAAADSKELDKAFASTIPCPLPDHSTRLKLWQRAIITAIDMHRDVIETQHIGPSRSAVVPTLETADDAFGGAAGASMAISTLAALSASMSAGTIIECAQSVMTERRVQRLLMRPLHLNEFVSKLAKAITRMYS